MSKVWRELADPKKHLDFMKSFNEGGVPVEAANDNLLEKWVYFADVHNFTFQFSSLDQVRECKIYFSKLTLPSTREAGPHLEHYWHAWFSKLPKGMSRKARREKVIKASDQILNEWG